MKKELSIYLDIVRFTAAMVVFLGHASGNLTGGFLWQLNSYLSASVMVFFVLSGFVIAFVYDTKEKTIKEYTIARVSRLSSIVIPALLITVIFDQAGILINEGLYYNGPWEPPQNEFINYLLSLFLLQNIWGLNLNPGINVPFWSLSFELLFYCLFASMFYLKGKIRVITFVLLLLLAGPDIIIYFPIWMMGVFIYYLLKKDNVSTRPISMSIISIVTAILLIIFIPWIKKNMSYSPEILITQRNILADYIYALIFSIHLITVSPLIHYFKIFLIRISKPISYLAGFTFSLYLFHRPLIQFFATFSEDPSSVQNRILVILGTLIVVLVIGGWSEKQKYTIKTLLRKWTTTNRANL